MRMAGRSPGCSSARSLGLLSTRVLYQLGFLASAANALVPGYTAQRPNYEKPNGGLPLLQGAVHNTVFKATPELGTYNHQAQIERHGGAFHVAWKSSPFNEDEDGQRILYSSSADGRAWSAPSAVFPSMPASEFGCDGDHCWDKIHHEGSPLGSGQGQFAAQKQMGVCVFPLKWGVCMFI